MAGSQAAGGSDTPDADRLASLDADEWAALLPFLRAAMIELPDDVIGARGVDLRSQPTGRLVGGSLRRVLCELGSDPAVWQWVHQRIQAEDPVPVPLRWVVEGPPQRAVWRQQSDPSRDDGVDRHRLSARDRERLRRLKEERDVARRQVAGADARAEAAQQQLTALERALDRAQRRIEELERQLSGHAQVVQQAVDREARRRDADHAKLLEEVASLRRAEHDRRQEAARRAEQTPSSGSRLSASDALQPGEFTERFVPGRPSRLPVDVAPGTTEAIDLYLHRGRRVLVDGYNVTLQHRSSFDLLRQRAWLVEGLANLARQRGVRPMVFFDGEGPSTGHRSGGGREVTVRFTGENITADDDIILELESTDEPVVVVTDDRELSERARQADADVIATQGLLWVLP